MTNAYAAVLDKLADRKAGLTKPKSVWRRRGLKTETRHVIDRTIGGDVFYAVRRGGTWDRYTCSLAEWNEWASKAKELKR